MLLIRPDDVSTPCHVRMARECEFKDHVTGSIFHYLIVPTVSLLVMMAVGAPVFAQPVQKPEAAAPRSLAPVQLDAIRAIGRNVLAAKHRAVDDPADADLLETLRADVDRLAAESARPPRPSITVQGQKKTPSPGKALGKSLTAPPQPDRAATRALVERLQRRAATLEEARVRATAGAETRLAARSQRARLFKRWAEQLDAALAADAGDRVARLRALQSRLARDQRGLTDTPRAHTTPTLQAMPAGTALLVNTKPARP